MNRRNFLSKLVTGAIAAGATALAGCGLDTRPIRSRATRRLIGRAYPITTQDTSGVPKQHVFSIQIDGSARRALGCNIAEEICKGMEKFNG